MGLFRKNVNTIVSPSTYIKNELTITNHDLFNLHGYWQDKSKFGITESGSIITQLPKQNLKSMCNKLLNKQCNDIKDCEVLVAYNNGVHTKKYTDGYGFYFGSIIEDNDGIACNVRADVASEFIRKGNVPIQCNEGICQAIFPNSITVDLKRFARVTPSQKK